MLRINTVVINTIASKIAYNIQQSLYNINNNISMPIGAILGSKYLAGFGPKINIKLLPAGNVITEFKSEFKSARN